MKKEGYYSSGTFAKMAHVTKKTLRYYNDQSILKPSFVAENGTRYYTDNDFAKLQQILFLKYLSFPLADIKELTVRGADREFWLESLKMQTSLLDEHIEQLTVMKKSLQEAQETIEAGNDVNWSDMLLLSNTNEMEQSLKKQYANSSNISARIHLHTEYSRNQEGWFPWLYRITDIQPGERVLELGCGDGTFWTQNLEKVPERVAVVISDISNGIVRETARIIRGKAGTGSADPADSIVIGGADSILKNFKTGSAISTSLALEANRTPRLRYQAQSPVVPAPVSTAHPAHLEFCVIDAHHIPAGDNTFDLVIANHMLFYCEDLNRALSEIQRVLIPGGRLICSTYGAKHMQEISNLVQQYDDRIVLSADTLYERFGKENGKEILADSFRDVEWKQFSDELYVTKPEPLISYILSCHGNQNRYIVEKYHEFYTFVKKKTDKGFSITKDAGVFIARK